MNGPDNIGNRLSSIYDEVMWLASRENVTPAMARAWYTHVHAEKVKKCIRRFSGKVSTCAVNDLDGPLRLEHFCRIQTTLTKLVKSHKENGRHSPEEFVKCVLACERVHIVTLKENYRIMSAKGDYALAGVSLVPWKRIPTERQKTLWQRMLRGRVSNAVKYKLNLTS